MRISAILGLNARSRLFSYAYNSSRGKKIASSKLLTKRVLKKAGIQTPQTFAKFTKPRTIFEFDWSSLPASFALKPSRGLGGEGIIVVKKRAQTNGLAPHSSSGEVGWITTQRKKVTQEDLKLHTLDILEGAYSVGNVPDNAFIEEYVGRNKAFRKFAYRGTPDIRIVVFNKVPVMAMLRLPTRESGGRANLHQGAIGVGIDIATGITTHGIWHDTFIRFKPGTKRKLHGIKIPNWTRILEIAVQCQLASGLGYLGADIVLHPEKGPLVLELNAYPGLQIQLANMQGLRKRLERVEDLEVRDAEHGVEIAKALFAERFSSRVVTKDGIKTIGVWEPVRIILGKRHFEEVIAKIDTGAYRTSIDREFAQEIGLLKQENILWSKVFRGSFGKQEREVIKFKFHLAGRQIKTIANVANRKGLRTPLIVGRKDLHGFLVKPRNPSRLPKHWAKGKSS